MRRHKRDRHDVITGSTSPPIKRKQKQHTEEEIQKMDIENDGNISDLSSQLEDMDIDDLDKDDKEMNFERSDLMDQKIQDKDKRIEE